jgi:hypothetical protein
VAPHANITVWGFDGLLCSVDAVQAQVLVHDSRHAGSRRADLLAQFAGTYLGLSQTKPVDQRAAQMVAQASLAARAGADMDAVAQWIPAGVERGEIIQASRGRG